MELWNLKKGSFVMEIKNICVVGGGRMGRQIALNAAIYGYGASVYDVAPAVLEDVKKWADEYLAGRIAKGKLTEEQVAHIKSIFRVESDLAKACEGVDCVIEAVVEFEVVKHKLFQQLDKVVGKDVILATNSSYMVSSIFAKDVSNPSRLCNMHFYNPALVMKFVEIVQGPHTSEETARAAYEFCQKTGKKPIWQKKEIPGFAGNFLIAGLYDRAKYLVQNGYCTYQDVDIAMEEGFNHPMGPFRLNDLTGVNLAFDMMKAEYERTGKKPDMYDIYEDLVKRGRIGRSVGHGFYDYE